MSDLDLTRLMKNARISLPGAIDSAIKNELFAVMKEFFQKSSCWRETVPFGVDPDDTEQTYQLVPSMGIVTQLMWVKDEMGNQRRFGTMDEPGVLVLNETPSSPAEWTANIALSVDEPKTEDGYPQFPQWVIDRYENGLLDGILGRMYGQPAKPYTSGQAAMMKMKFFRATINEATIAANQSNVYGAQAWRFPKFA